jgi:hypothetical protein
MAGPHEGPRTAAMTVAAPHEGLSVKYICKRLAARRRLAARHLLLVEDDEQNDLLVVLEAVRRVGGDEGGRTLVE